MENEELKKGSREKVEDKVKEGLDLYEDKVFIRHLVKKAQKIDPDIGGVFFAEQKILVFFWRNVIIYKLYLNEDNVEKLSISHHLKKIETVLRMLKSNLIPIRPLQDQARDFNKFKTGKVI